MRRTLLTIVLSLVLLLCLGQQRQVFIKGEYYNKPLAELLQEIELKHDVKFLYLDELVEHEFVSGIIKNSTPLVEALEKLLADKAISIQAQTPTQIVLFENVNKTLKTSAQIVKLMGQVKDKNSGEPLPYVTVYIPHLTKGTTTDEKGRFEIKPLPKGTQLIQFSYVGYLPLTEKIELKEDKFITVELSESTFELSELVITPSAFEISTLEPTPLALGKEEILHSPNMSKDIYRTLKALPGIANNDYSSKARIRGGHSDETSVYLDNFLINDPFHLEEVDGTFSIFNTDYINEVMVLTGGFSAPYTDRLSGVMDVKTFEHISTNSYKVSLDLINSSLLGQQKISGKTNVFFNVRRGYLDFLLKNMDAQGSAKLTPRFSDFWGKVTHQINDKNSISVNFLMGRDNFHVIDIDDLEMQLDLKNVRDNVNSWINWKYLPNKSFNSITTLGYQLGKKKARFTFSDNINYNNIDNNNTSSVVLTNNSYWHLEDGQNIEFGVEFKPFKSSYQYNEVRYDVYNSSPENVIIEDIDFESDFTGYTGSAFAQYNWELFDGLIIQPGLRASTQSFSKVVKCRPRFALSYKLVEDLTFKTAWGIYYQPDLHYKLRTSLSQREPYARNSKAAHYNASLTYNQSTFNAMLNLYYKDYSYLYDDYRFEFFNRINSVNILDIPFGTTSGYAEGLEIMLRKQYGKRSMISASYAYSKSKIQNDKGENTFRDFDQPHTFIVNNIFKPGKHLSISLLWSYHTGYPYTPTEVDFIRYRPEKDGLIIFYEAGLKNSKRLPDFHSLDIRVEKVWSFKKSALTIYVNFVNFYNRKNIRNYFWGLTKNRSGIITFEEEKQFNIPSFISPGISFNIY